jgi:hypothetical protein
VSTIVRIENYGLLPTIKVLTAIAEVLDLSLDEIARPGRAAAS